METLLMSEFRIICNLFDARSLTLPPIAFPKLQACKEFAESALAMGGEGRQRCLGDFLFITLQMIKLFVEDAKGERFRLGPDGLPVPETSATNVDKILPLMHSFQIIVLLFQGGSSGPHGESPGGEGNGGATTTKPKLINPSDQAQILFLLDSESGIPLEQALGQSMTIGEYTLSELGDNFDYILREIVFNRNINVQGSNHAQNARSTAQAMWQTLKLCIGGVGKIDGETLLELCGNELVFPVALAKLLVPLECDITLSLSDLWSAAKSVKSASPSGRNLPNNEAGSIEDLYNFKTQLAAAFIDYDILSVIMRGLVRNYELWENSEEIQEWLLAYMTSDILNGKLVIDYPNINLIQQQNNGQFPSEVREIASNIIYLLLSGCRCFRELIDIVDTKEFQKFAEDLGDDGLGGGGTLIDQLKRHIAMYGRAFLQRIVEPYFPLNNNDNENSDIDMKIRMLLLSSRGFNYYTNYSTTTTTRLDVSSSTSSNYSGIINSDKLTQDTGKITYTLCETLLCLKRVDDEKIYTDNFRKQMKKTCSCKAPPNSCSNDPLIVSAVLILGLDAKTDYNLDYLNKNNGIMETTHATLQTQTVQLWDKIQRLTCDKIDWNSANGALFVRAVKKWLVRFYEIKGERQSMEYWQAFTTSIIGTNNSNNGVSSCGVSIEPPSGYNNYKEDFTQGFTEGMGINAMNPSSIIVASNPTTAGANGIMGDATMMGNVESTEMIEMPRIPPQDLPPHFRCAIDGRVMTTPVRFVSPQSGITIVYEMSTLEEWREQQGNICPVSGEPLGPGTLNVDENLKFQIGQFFAQGGQRGS